MFVQQTDDHLKNYSKYEILNYPADVDASKRVSSLTLKEVKMVRNSFDILQFSKIPIEEDSTNERKVKYKTDFLKAFADEKLERTKISKSEARKTIHERYCEESEHGKALRINWKLVDLSQIPDRYSMTLEIIKSGDIFDHKTIFKTPKILDNIHFFPIDKDILTQKEANVLIEARGILIAQYRKEIESYAQKINWDRIETISGLDGINFIKLSESRAREIIKRKDQIKFEPFNKNNSTELTL